MSLTRGVLSLYVGYRVLATTLYHSILSVKSQLAVLKTEFTLAARWKTTECDLSKGNQFPCSKTNEAVNLCLCQNSEAIVILSYFKSLLIMFPYLTLRHMGVLHFGHSFIFMAFPSSSCFIHTSRLWNVNTCWQSSSWMKLFKHVHLKLWGTIFSLKKGLKHTEHLLHLHLRKIFR